MMVFNLGVGWVARYHYYTDHLGRAELVRYGQVVWSQKRIKHHWRAVDLATVEMKRILRKEWHK